MHSRMTKLNGAARQTKRVRYKKGGSRFIDSVTTNVYPDLAKEIYLVNTTITDVSLKESTDHEYQAIIHT